MTHAMGHKIGLNCGRVPRVMTFFMNSPETAARTAKVVLNYDS